MHKRFPEAASYRGLLTDGDVDLYREVKELERDLDIDVPSLDLDEAIDWDPEKKQALFYAMRGQRNTLAAWHFQSVLQDMEHRRLLHAPYGLYLHPWEIDPRDNDSPFDAQVTLSAIVNFDDDVKRGMRRLVHDSITDRLDPLEEWAKTIDRDSIPLLTKLSGMPTEKLLYAKYHYLTGYLMNKLTGRYPKDTEQIHAGTNTLASLLPQITRISGEAYLREAYTSKKGKKTALKEMSAARRIYPLVAWLASLHTAHFHGVVLNVSQSQSSSTKPEPIDINHARLISEDFTIDQTGALVPKSAYGSMYDHLGRPVFKTSTAMMRTGCIALVARISREHGNSDWFEKNERSMNAIKYFCHWNMAIAAQTLFPDMLS